MDVYACVHVLVECAEATQDEDMRLEVEIEGISAKATNAANRDAILAVFGVFFLDFFLAEETGFGLAGVSGKSLVGSTSRSAVLFIFQSLTLAKLHRNNH